MSETAFTIEMGELKSKINFVRNGLGTSKTDLSVQMMRFDVKPTKVSVFTMSNEAYCLCTMKRLPGEDDSEGSFTVHGNKIEKLISQVEAETVSFKADSENLECKAGHLTVNFELYDGTGLRTMEQSMQEQRARDGGSIDRAALEEALSCGKSCTTADSIRPDVTHVELREGRVLSSDGRKILIYTHDAFDQALKLKVPSSVITPVLSAVKNIQSELVSIVDGDNYYIINAGLDEYSLGIRKVERDFPAVEGQITQKQEPNDEVGVDKHVLEAILRGVALGLPSDEVKVDVEVGGTGVDAYIEVSSTNSLGRRSFERASCGRKAEETLSFPVSFKHLLDTIGVFKGDSVIDMMLMNDLNMLMVRDTTDAREVMTIIPHRTQAQVQKEADDKEASDLKRKADAEVELEEPAEDQGELADTAIDL